jgi:hypothetical protein
MIEITQDNVCYDIKKLYYIRKDGQGGIITHTGYFAISENTAVEPGKFTIRLFDNITIGDSFFNVEQDTLKDLIDKALDRGIQIFAFDSIEGLMVYHLAKFCYKIDPHDDEAVASFFELINGV